MLEVELICTSMSVLVAVLKDSKGRSGKGKQERRMEKGEWHYKNPKMEKKKAYRKNWRKSSGGKIKEPGIQGKDSYKS